VESSKRNNSSTVKKPVIVLHSFGLEDQGGPCTGVNNILTSSLVENFNFVNCRQTRPAGGLNLPLIWSMAKTIRAAKPDLLHVQGLQNEGFHGVMAGVLAGCPRILISVHGFMGDIRFPRSKWGQVRRWIVSKVLEPITLSLVDGIYCVCEYAAKRPEIAHHAAKSFGYVHNAIPAFRLAKGTPPVSREELGLPVGILVGATICRVTREKGLFDLCDALGLLRSQGLQIKHVIVGDGEDSRELNEYAERVAPGVCVFVGTRHDVIDVLEVCDYFVFPSLHENLPFAILEAMSCGKAIVATSVGGVPELIVDGESGLLVPPSDPAALAAAILRVLRDDDLKQRLGENAKKRAETNFSLDGYVEEMTHVYNMMLQR
jgi:glycosyltransferase involved in cell wall biosynthesis